MGRRDLRRLRAAAVRHDAAGPAAPPVSADDGKETKADDGKGSDADASAGVAKPAPPKKPMTGYLLHATSVREDVKKDMPGKAFGDVSKCIGSMWVELPEEEKAPFLEQAASAQKIFVEEVKEYVKKHGPIESKQKASSKRQGENKSECAMHIAN